MKFDWENWNIGGKVIFVAGCVAMASMLMKWVDISLASQSGLSQGAFWLLLLWIYPVLMLFKNKSIHRIWGLACSVCSVVFSLGYISSKSIEVFGETVNAAANGAYLFLFASIALIVGIVKYKPVTSEENNISNSSEDKNDQIYRVINQDQNKPIDLTETITNFYKTFSSDKSKNIWCLEQIPNEYIEKHKKNYLELGSDEKVLVLLNKGAMFGIFSGLLITNTCIHFCTLKKSFFVSILPWFFKGVKGKAYINGLKSLEIAEHDTSFGTAYVGHELRINDEILGYVRMGTNTLLDSEAIIFLNSLFDHFAENGIIERKVKNYNWQ